MKIRIFLRGAMAKRQNRSTLRRREADALFHQITIPSSHHSTILSFHLSIIPTFYQQKSFYYDCLHNHHTGFISHYPNRL